MSQRKRKVPSLSKFALVDIQYDLHTKITSSKLYTDRSQHSTSWYLRPSSAEEGGSYKQSTAVQVISSHIQGHLYDLLSAHGTIWNLALNVHVGTTPAHRIDTPHHITPLGVAPCTKQKTQRGNDVFLIAMLLCSFSWITLIVE